MFDRFLNASKLLLENMQQILAAEEFNFLPT